MPTRVRGTRLAWTSAALGAVLGACGAIGDPLPPLQNLPLPVSDLAVRQVGRQIEIEWTWPLLTTEGTIAREIGGFAVWAVDVPGFSDPLTPETIDTYRRPVRSIDAAELAGNEPGESLLLRSPLADWRLGQAVVVVVTGSNRGGTDAGYSNQAGIQPLDPPEAPQWIRAEPGPAGIALSWREGERAEEYSIERADGEDGMFSPLGRLAISSFVDRTASWGSTYLYRLRPYRKSSAGWVEGPLSEQVAVIHEDTFAPPVPEGLRAVPTDTSVELSWLPSPDEDVSEYRLLRDGEDLAGPLRATTFSDSTAVEGTAHVYALTAIDAAGNESEPSAGVRAGRSRAGPD